MHIEHRLVHLIITKGCPGGLHSSFFLFATYRNRVDRPISIKLGPLTLKYSLQVSDLPPLRDHMYIEHRLYLFSITKRGPGDVHSLLYI